MSKQVTCQIRYRLNLEKIEAFREYAQIWIHLIQQYGGVHHGCFIPANAPTAAGLSFPDIGHEGPADVAIALFTFADEESYTLYRERVSRDPECERAAALVRDTRCFTSYERIFLKPL